MSMFSQMLHPERGYQAAEDAARQYYDQAQGYQRPFMEYGQQAYGQLSESMQQLLNPQKLESDWMSGYEKSPYAQDLQNQALDQGLGAASSMGLMGSSPAIRAIEGKGAEIGRADRQQYLNDLMQKYLAGTGIAQNIFGVGANTAGQMGNRASQMGTQMSELEYGRENAPGSMMSNLLGGAATLGGAVLGGPVGAGVANLISPGTFNHGGR